ncbi:MAG: hypothetical protein NC517_08645 [Firmicutes bacterium]|nr:hypothetical protein [Bacillota bacterium]
MLLTPVTALASAIVYVTASLTSLKNADEQTQKEISSIKEEIRSTNNNIEELASLVDDDHEFFIQLASLGNYENAYKVVFQDTYNVKTETIKNEEYLAPPSWGNDDIIASDIEGDIIYRAEDLYDTLIITSYTEGNEETYFYGRFNENNHWNGKCVLNIYEGDKLVSIFEGIYDDGELFSYKAVIEGKNSTWVVNDRKRQGNYNSGETWTYEKTKDFIKGFSPENVKDKQILTVEKFLTSQNERLMNYYKGNTSNNIYNDNTGNARYVKYSDNGDVEYLYVGKVENGKLTDQSGDAWSISWGYADDGYYYYNGPIKDGAYEKKPKDWHPMTQEEIENKVDSDFFGCPLTGLID